MDSDVVKTEKIDDLQLVYHFAVPLSNFKPPKIFKM